MGCLSVGAYLKDLRAEKNPIAAIDRSVLVRAAPWRGLGSLPRQVQELHDHRSGW